jgi:putative transposase
MMGSETLRYRFRVYPDAVQKDALSRIFGCVRVVFNDHLALNAHRVFGPRKKYIGYYKSQSMLISKAKKTVEREWLTDAPSHALQHSVAAAHGAFEKMFRSASVEHAGRRVGEPRFKRKDDHNDSFTLSRTDYRIRRTGKRETMLRLPKKVGELRMVQTRNFPSRPTSVTIIREPDGRYYASFVVKRGTHDLPAVDRVAAVDLGLTDLATIVYSDGTREKIPAPKHYRRAQLKLARAQKEHARRQKGSANREKSRIKVAQIHRKVREIRADEHHKLALRLVRENQTVVFETLSITGLARTKMAKSVNDAGWGNLIRLTKEKANRFGRTVVQIGRFIPTTQTCAPCRLRGGKLALNIREWTCAGCGAFLDRDYNAAVNVMIASGTVEIENACGGNGSPVLLAALAAPEETAETQETGNDSHQPEA